MPKPDEERKARNLVPLWLLDSDNPVLARMAKRPVGIDMDELGVSMSGELRELSLTHARIAPERTFFLCRSVYVEIRFRYLDTVYTLSGLARPSLPDHSFIFDFDSVARKVMGDLGKKLKTLGLLDASRAEPEAQVPKPLDPVQRVEGTQLTPRQLARYPRHLPPPGGIERRAAHRYDVETWAHVTLLSEARAIECLIVDMSRGGCRLYFEEPCDMKPGARIEIQFTEDGYPLRLAAVVQVRANEYSAGLRFIRTSERMTERLDTLLWEIAERSAGRY